VTLESIRPQVWRHLEVDGATTLAKLHEVLQIDFGWSDSQLHQYDVDGVAYGAPDTVFVSSLRDERRTRLRDVLFRSREGMV
jgi:hypothetical protein